MNGFDEDGETSRDGQVSGFLLHRFCGRGEDSISKAKLFVMWLLGCVEEAPRPGAFGTDAGIVIPDAVSQHPHPRPKKAPREKKRVRKYSELG